jgi:phosphoribosylformylglycinamidine synthase
VLEADREDWHRCWDHVSAQITLLRDEPQSAREEADRLARPDDRLDLHLPALPARRSWSHRPRVAILRDQGVNGQAEMAAAFHRAGFLAVDVPMSDLQTGATALDDYVGLAACGGFSYGDVLGAGGGWAASILEDPNLRRAFATFFTRQDTFTLGVCNGCQMLSALKALVPGAEHWPRFIRNRSEQFEGRFSLVEIVPSPSVLLAGMAGSRLPVAVSHGEGRAEFASAEAESNFAAAGLTAFHYVDNHGAVASRYPANPNGSPRGIAAVTSTDGRVTLTMPHPERSFRYVQNSWRPDDAGDVSGWMRLFRNARVWVG